MNELVLHKFHMISFLSALWNKPCCVGFNLGLLKYHLKNNHQPSPVHPVPLGITELAGFLYWSTIKQFFGLLWSSNSCHKHPNLFLVKSFIVSWICFSWFADIRHIINVCFPSDELVSDIQTTPGRRISESLPIHKGNKRIHRHLAFLQFGTQITLDYERLF